MTPMFSVYLDLLRFLAALAVLLSHARPHVLISADLPLSFGHNAVVLFFVLSGYVISYIADSKETTATDFWLSRFARIYSVALPAIALTIGLDLLGEKLDPQYYAEDVTTHDNGPLRLLASLTFTNEIWFLAILSFSNAPYWSLCYEMSYYLLFSIWAYAPTRLRWPLLLAAGTLIGPKILLLAPIWLLGVCLHRWREGYQLKEAGGWAFWIGSTMLMVAFLYWDLNDALADWLKARIGERPFELLNQSQYFLADYLLAFLVAAHFLGFRAVAHRFQGIAGPLRRLIVPLAGATFSIYLFHAPLLHFFQALLVDQQHSFGGHLLATLLTILSCLMLAHWTEGRKGQLRRWLEARLWPRVQRLRAALQPSR